MPVQKKSGNLLHVPHTSGITVSVANGPGDWSSIPIRVITKTEKMVLDVFLLNTHHYKL